MKQYTVNISETSSNIPRNMLKISLNSWKFTCPNWFLFPGNFPLWYVVAGACTTVEEISPEFFCSVGSVLREHKL